MERLKSWFFIVFLPLDFERFSGMLELLMLLVLIGPAGTLDGALLWYPVGVCIRILVSGVICAIGTWGAEDVE